MSFQVSISEIVDLLGLEIKPRQVKGASFNARCPFCSDKGYHLNINTVKGVYCCVRCMGSEKGAGALDLYARVRHGYRAVPGVNTKEIYHELMEELGKGKTFYPQPVIRQEEDPEILPAQDSDLHRAYHAMLHLPYLKLTKEHEANLLKRGLRKETIFRNEYASVRPAEEILKELSLMPEHLSITETDLNLKEAEIQIGRKIASDILSMGINVNRVPGFFRIGEDWCVKVTPGILIPTRNCRGEIVGIQTRRDVKTKKGLRYLTLSSKGLKDGVTCHISRTHFASGNGSVHENSEIFLTEGPLKGDTALDLLQQMGRNGLVICLQGVSSTRELPEITDKLIRCGCLRIYEALDMDKLTNPNVYHALEKITFRLREKGVEVINLLWDEKYAAYRRFVLEELMQKKGIFVPSCPNDFAAVLEMVQELTQREIDYDHFEADGQIFEEPKWNERTKGIDDYLLSVLKGS